MTQFLSEVLSVTTPVTIFTSTLLGFLIGGFYGYQIAADRGSIYPFGLWMVGILFIVMLAVTGLISSPGVPTMPFSVGRAVLWTFTCGMIPIGVVVRQWWDLRRVRARLKALKDEMRRREL